MTKGSPISPSLMANKAPAMADAAKTKDVAASVLPSWTASAR